MLKVAPAFLLSAVLFAFFCTVKPESQPVNEDPPLLTADAVDAALKAFPREDITSYTAVTDPNALLGRPGQYTAKVNWTDKRGGGHLDCSFEVFANEADAERRRIYVETVGNSAPMFLSYVLRHKNVVLRIDRRVTPEQFEGYKRAFLSL